MLLLCQKLWKNRKLSETIDVPSGCSTYTGDNTYRGQIYCILNTCNIEADMPFEVMQNLVD